MPQQQWLPQVRTMLVLVVLVLLVVVVLLLLVLTTSLVPQFRSVIAKASMRNFVVYQGGGGVEVAGALQAVSDLLLQSVTLPDLSGSTFLVIPALNPDFSMLPAADYFE